MKKVSPPEVKKVKNSVFLKLLTARPYEAGKVLVSPQGGETSQPKFQTLNFVSFLGTKVNHATRKR